MESLPHYFIGVPVSQEVKDILSVWQEDLKTVFPFEQWTFKDDLHITLRFLGPVNENTISRLDNMLKQMENQKPFSLDVKDINFFGNPKRPRVLYAEVEKAAPLRVLYNHVEACLEHIGYSKETRPYRPHITLAKKWNNPASYRPRFDKQTDFLQQNVILKVDHAALFQVLPKQKPKYKAVYRYTLQGETNGTTD